VGDPHDVPKKVGCQKIGTGFDLKDGAENDEREEGAGIV
jgi:hypothetical protein